MMGPKRLVIAGSQTAQSLLRAAKGDHPPASLVPAVIGTLENAPAGVMVLGKLARGVRRAVLSKLAVGAVAIAAAASGGGYVVTRMHARAPNTEVAPQPSALVARIDAGVGADRLSAATERPATPDKQAERVPPEPRSIDVATAPPRIDRPTRLQSPAAASQPMSSSSKPSILGELDDIRHVRSLIATSDGHAALAALDAYGTSHPAGTFEEEALALRVRALRLTGDLDSAERTLGTLEARFPNSVHLGALKPGTK